MQFAFCVRVFGDGQPLMPSSLLLVATILLCLGCGPPSTQNSSGDALLAASTFRLDPKANLTAEGLAAVQVFSPRVKERALILEQAAAERRLTPDAPEMAAALYELLENLTLKSKTIRQTFVSERVTLRTQGLDDGSQLVVLRIEGERPAAKFVITYGQTQPAHSSESVYLLTAQAAMVELARSFVANFSKGSEVRRLWPTLEFVWVFGSAEGFEFLEAIRRKDEQLWGVVDIGTQWPEKLSRKQLVLVFDGREGQDLFSRAAASVGPDLAGPGWRAVAFDRGGRQISSELRQALKQEQVPLLRVIAARSDGPIKTRATAFAAPRRTFEMISGASSSSSAKIAESPPAASWPPVMLCQFVASFLIRLSSSLAR
ncbi:MAG: hypothetical protein V3W41_01865 [Planctomycetota bacterium]